MPRSSPVVRFHRNEHGQDYVVGDIHGEFDKLKEQLSRLNFDRSQDRLFSVGDLVDRGPHSPRALEWLKQPWFHAVLGNHESMCVASEGDKAMLEWWTGMNGGEWWLKLDSAQRRAFLQAFRQLPLAIEVETRDGLVGIVHADVPPNLSWQEFIDDLEFGNARVREHALWSRMRVNGRTPPLVDGIYRLFCGHTPLERPYNIGNVFFLDTGACYGGRLTVTRIDTPSTDTEDS